MTPTLDRTTLVARREELLARLASAQTRLRDAKFKASLDDAFAPEMNEAEELVRQLEQQIEGLSDGEAKVSEHEAAEAEAARLARRRADAVELLRLLPERDALAARAHRMIIELAAALADVIGANSAIASKVMASSGRSDLGEALAGTVLVKLAPAADHLLLDRLQSQINGIVRTANAGSAESGTHPVSRSYALDVIARALPEVRDAAVQTESGAAIDPAFLPH